MEKHSTRSNPWLILVILFLSGMTFSASNNKVAATMTLLMEDLNIDAGTSGLLITCTAVIGIALALPAGGICAKIGARKVGLIALLCCLSGNLLGALAPNIQILLVTRMIEGFAFGIANIFVPAIISSLFPPQKQALPMGIWSCWVAAGTMFIMMSAESMVNPTAASSWRNVWYILAAMAGILLILFFLFVKLPQSENDSPTSPSSDDLKKGFFSFPAWCLALIMFGMSFGVCACNSFASTYLQSSAGMTLAAANQAASMISLGMILGGIVIGLLLNHFRNYPVFMLGASVLITVVFCLFFRMSGGSVTLFLLISGVVFSMLPPALLTMAPQTSKTPQLIGVTMSIVTIGNNLATTGASITGSVIDRFGWNATLVPLAINGFLCILGSILLISWQRRQQSS